MLLPLWLEDNKYPEYLRKAAREVGEEVLAIETVPEDVREAVAGLRTCCILWSWQYYNGESTVTDEVYDAAFKYIQIREARYPELITPLSPTQRVGKIMNQKEENNNG
jgi:DNA ligase (NAD+)